MQRFDNSFDFGFTNEPYVTYIQELLDKRHVKLLNIDNSAFV